MNDTGPSAAPVASLRPDEVELLNAATRCRCGHLSCFHYPDDYAAAPCALCDCFEPSAPAAQGEPHA